MPSQRKKQKQQPSLVVYASLFVAGALGCLVRTHQLFDLRWDAHGENLGVKETSQSDFRGWHHWCEIVQKNSVQRKHSVWADKHAVKGLIEKFVPHLNYAQELAVVDNPAHITASLIRAIDQPFVMKANHMSGGLVFVREDKATCVGGSCVAPSAGEPLHVYLRRCCAIFSTINYAWEANEKWYSWIPKKCLFERLLSAMKSPDLRDFKVWFMLGRVVFVQIDSGRYTLHHRNYVTETWMDIPMNETAPAAHPQRKSNGPKPFYWENMLHDARTLAAHIDLPHVRIDFFGYETGYSFAEVTFAHESCQRGRGGFIPKEAERYCLQLQLDENLQPDGILEALRT